MSKSLSTPAAGGAAAPAPPANQEPATQQTGGFDRLCMVGAGGEEQYLTRVRLLADGRLRFFRQGEQVSSWLALKGR
jgi:hypothetical protein